METYNHMVLFYHKRMSEVLFQQYACSENICVEKVELEMLIDHRNQTLFFALPNVLIGSATALCKQAGCENVYILVLDNGCCMNPIRVDVSKPRLDYMETELARICNLHCRACCDFIQLADSERPFYDLQTFIHDLKQLKNLFWGIEKIRLMGGEPLLLKNLADYAEHTRRIFPDTDLRIVTNGLLIRTLSTDTLVRLKKYGCTFDISNYPPTKQHRTEIASILHNFGIPFSFGVPIRYFFKTIAAQPSDDAKPSFENCLFTHCHMLSEGGLLSPCSYAYCIRRFNHRFGTDYPESDVVDLYNTDLNGWQIAELFSKPHLFCTCCTRDMIPIRWKDGVHSEKAMMDDWIVSENVWTRNVFPIFQRILKPAGKELRRLIQKRK